MNAQVTMTTRTLDSVGNRQVVIHEGEKNVLISRVDPEVKTKVAELALNLGMTIQEFVERLIVKAVGR